jgi:putative PIN family toxin of toxin-antitoxin system
MHRVVLDPGVLISAVLARDGAPAQLLLLWIEGRFEIVVSPQLLAELRRMLLRPKFRDRMTERDVLDYVTLFARRGIRIEDPPDPERLAPDPNDNYLLALARASGARLVISGDAHLTELAIADIRIMTPRAFLDILRAS